MFHRLSKFSRTKRFQLILLIAIVLLGAFLRLYNAPYRYSLGEETVRDAVIGIQGARTLQAPLTGSFSSLGPFTFGPLYAYQFILATLVLQTPYAPWIYLSIVSLLYLVVIYKIGVLLYNKNFGLLLAFIAAISPAQVISATHLTSHNMTNIFAILTIWIFIKLVKKDLSYWWGFAMGLALGTGINMHYQMAGLLILPALLFLVKPKKYLYLFTAGLGVFVTFIPLLFFELVNNWFNVRNMVDYALYGRQRIYVPNRWLFYVRDFWPAFWADALGVPSYMGIPLILASFGVLFLAYTKKLLPRPLVLLLIAFLCNFILLRFYWGQRFFGYLNFLRPFVFILTALFIWQVSKLRFGKYLAALLLFGLVVLSFQRSVDQLIQDPFTMSLHSEIDSLEQKVAKKPYTIYGCTKKYKGSYNSQTFSLTFITDLRKEASVNGTPIGLSSPDCPMPEAGKKFPIISPGGLIDFSQTNHKALTKAGWTPMTFAYIYDLNVLWWLKKP